MVGRDALLVDVDGTLVDVRPVLHYLDEPGSDWRAFHEASRFCPPIGSIIAAVRQAAADGHAILIVPARDVRYERPTRDFLARHTIPYHGLFMRPWGDRRRDTEVKTDLYRQIVTAGWQPVHAYDDRPDIVRLWGTFGLPATLVGPPALEAAA
jgi:hypothetical protein